MNSKGGAVNEQQPEGGAVDQWTCCGRQQRRSCELRGMERHVLRRAQLPGRRVKSDKVGIRSA